MALATPADVAARLGRELAPEEITQVAVLLDDTELLLRARIPDLLEKVESGEIDRAVVVMIEANMVMRVLRNPQGFTQETDGNYSYTVSEKVASGLLDVTDVEWALLGVTGGLFLIAPTTPVPWCTRTWVPEMWT